jgi:plasmid stabilization system protein ParE
MRRVVWSEAARRGLEHIRDYVGRFSPLAAQRMAVRLEAAGDSLGEFGDRGRRQKAAGSL